MKDKFNFKELLLTINAAFLTSYIMRKYFPYFGTSLISNIQIALGFVFILLILDYLFRLFFDKYFGYKSKEKQLIILCIIFVVVIAILTLLSWLSSKGIRIPFF